MGQFGRYPAGNAIAPEMIQTVLSECYWKDEAKREKIMEDQPVKHLGTAGGDRGNGPAAGQRSGLVHHWADHDRRGRAAAAVTLNTRWSW